MVCEKCTKTVDDRIGLAANTSITRGAFWCRECFEAAGGKFIYMPTATSDIEARQQRARAERIAAHEQHEKRRRVSEKKALHKRVKKTAKARKNATLLITRLLRT